MMELKEIKEKIEGVLFSYPRSEYKSAGVFAIGNASASDSPEAEAEWMQVSAGNTYEMAQGLTKALLDDVGAQALIPVLRSVLRSFVLRASDDSFEKMFLKAQNYPDDSLVVEIMRRLGDISKKNG